MFQALKQLLADSGEIRIVLRADGDNMKVIVSPTKAGDKSKPVLASPLALCASAEELDAGFIEAISTYTASHKSLAEQAEATATILKEAERAQVKKATVKTVAKPGSTKPSVQSDVSLVDAGGDDEHGTETEKSSSVTLPASTSNDSKDGAAVSDLTAFLMD